jgi:hypothetical protein
VAGGGTRSTLLSRLAKALQHRFHTGGLATPRSFALYCRYEQKLPYFRFNSRMEDGEPVRVLPLR